MPRGTDGAGTRNQQAGQLERPGPLGHHPLSPKGAASELPLPSSIKAGVAARCPGSVRGAEAAARRGCRMEDQANSWAFFPDATSESYDYSNMTELEFLPASKLTPVQWASLVIYALVFLVGVPGNAAVIWVTGFEMKRTVNTIWFLNLSVSDLLCCLALPFLAALLINDHHWALGDFACRLIPSLIILNMFASVLVLTAISVDRCALVTKPVWCQNHRSLSLAWGVCGVSWLLALLLTVPSFIFRRARHEVLSSKVTCGTDYSRAGRNQHIAEVLVAIFRFFCGFFIPFVVITTCYGLLLAKVQGSRFLRSSNKTLRVVLVVIVGFFVCWLPYHVVGLILACQSGNTPLFHGALNADPLVVSLAYVNSCINPIIYVIVGQDFKEKMQRSLRAVLHNVMREESTMGHSLRHSQAQTQGTTEDRSTSTTV
uniref:G-protein coupled receptors family 1 profile domain-containing protein n=1 Tax=Sphenodon punctatus TaxID=8508 RepID=A0A8D0H8J2_SPHPU